MACIFKRGKTWSFSIDIGKDEHGKRRKKGKGGFRTQSEAKKAATILEADIVQGTFVDEKRITFASFTKKWFTIYENTVKISTADLRKNHIKILYHFMADLYLKNISKMQYQKILFALSEKGYADKTIADIHSTASLIFQNACENGILKNNPAEKVIMPKENNRLSGIKQEIVLPKYMEKSELRSFLDTAKQFSDSTTYTMFYTLAYTGMRIGELSALRWQDVNFENSAISINHTIYMPGKAADYLLLSPKTLGSKRSVSVTADLLKLLKAHHLNQNKEKLRSDHWAKDSFVFTSPSRHGLPLTKQAIQYRMKKVLHLTNLPDTFTPHSLRHTHASLLAEAGANLESIMERLGHTNDATTRLIYLHITKNVKKDTAEKFQNLMQTV